MQTAKANSKSKQSGKTAVRTPAVSEAVAAQAQDPVAAGSPDMKPAEPQATDIGAVNPVAETSPAEQPAAHPETDVRLLDLNKIVNSTYNPRKNFREDTLLELAESIRQSGVLQPICVRPRDEGFEIVYGERRYWAAAMANLKFIPALVRDLSDAEAEDAAITENLQARGRAAARGSRRLQAGLAVGAAYDREPRGQIRQVGGLHPLASETLRIDRRLGRDARQRGDFGGRRYRDRQISRRHPAGGLQRSFRRGVLQLLEDGADQGDRPAALRALHDQVGKLQLR